MCAPHLPPSQNISITSISSSSSGNKLFSKLTCKLKVLSEDNWIVSGGGGRGPLVTRSLDSQQEVHSGSVYSFCCQADLWRQHQPPGSNRRFVQITVETSRRRAVSVSCFSAVFICVFSGLGDILSPFHPVMLTRGNTTPQAYISHKLSLRSGFSCFPHRVGLHLGALVRFSSPPSAHR